MIGRKRAGRAAGPAAVVLILLLVAACSGSASRQAAAPGGEQGAGAPTTAASAAPARGPASGGDAPGDPAPGTLIIRTGSLDLEVADVDAAVIRARDLIASMGGYVAGSDAADKGGAKLASITYRIPVERWQDAISGLRGFAEKVLHESTAAEEVTAQVVDLEARLTNLRASEASLRDIMTRAGTITEVLAVQDKLTEVREQIERITAQQKDLTGRAALGTLTANWQTPAAAAVSEVREGWDLGREIDRAAAQTIAAAQSAASFLVWLVVVGVPVLGPILLLLVIGIVLYRRWAAKRPHQPRQAGWGPPLSASVMSGPSWATSQPAPVAPAPMPAGPAAGTTHEASDPAAAESDGGPATPDGDTGTKGTDEKGSPPAG